MDCYYINLASAVQRKIDLENNFHRNRKPDWTLFRFPAVDAKFVKSANIPGDKSPAEKACFLSHKNVIGLNLDDGKPVFVMEDDSIIGSHTCAVIDSTLRSNRTLDWDILFTDVCIPVAGTMFDLIKLRQRLAVKNEITLIDLSKIASFAGANAYIVNAKSKRKVHALLDAVKQIDMPYDLVLRKLVFESALKGFSIFPFVTSLSAASEASQIQRMEVQATAVIWNMFRKLMWIERNLGECNASLELIKQGLCDEESNAFGVLFSAMASKKYRIV